MRKYFFTAICISLCTALTAVAQPPIHLASVSRPAPWVTIQPSVTQPAERIHVLLAGDTIDAKIGRSSEVDLSNFAALFRELVPDAGQLQMQTLCGDVVTKDNLLRAISQVRPGPNDAFVFVWTGHGAYANLGHYFHMPNGDGLYRADVVAAMRLHGPRLVVVLSGSCNELSNAVVQRVYRSHTCIHRAAEEEPHLAPIADALFVKPRGVVDINGASEGQLAFANSQRGCTFLHPLCNYLRENSHRRVTWQTLVNEVSPRVQSLLNEIYPQGYVHEPNQKRSIPSRSRKCGHCPTTVVALGSAWGPLTTMATASAWLTCGRATPEPT